MAKGETLRQGLQLMEWLSSWGKRTDVWMVRPCEAEASVTRRTYGATCLCNTTGGQRATREAPAELSASPSALELPGATVGNGTPSLTHPIEPGWAPDPTWPTQGSRY